jgi:hypothetical protein
MPSRRVTPADLSAPSDAEFYDALARLQPGALRGRPGGRFIASVALHLAARSHLPPRVQEQRLRAVIHRLSLDDAGLAFLAAAARRLSPALRNAVSSIISPALRRALGAVRHRAVRPAPLEHAAPRAAHTGEEQPLVAQRHTDHVATGTTDPDPFSTVVLLSRPAHQDSNKSLLTQSGYGPLVWDSYEKLKEDLRHNDDICACIVDQSALQDLDRDQQLNLFKDLAEYSTFLWIRVQEGSHLAVERSEVRRIVRSAWCLRERVPAECLSFQADSVLRAAELVDVARARDALRARDRAQFVPGELTLEESRLLVAAARAHLRDLDPDGGPVILESLETEFLKGGHTNARVARVRPNQGGRPVIAKIDTKERVLDEVRRFRQFIQPWDDRLRPEAQFHAGAAVILFGLVPDIADATRPADMLEERLRDLWNSQILGGNDAALRFRAEALGRAITNAAHALGDLNGRRALAPGYPPVGNPPAGYFAKWDAVGLDWGLGEEARTARRNAELRFERLASAGVVHGDVHLRNILVRGETEAHLIDYAGSGPGHPAVDLARLELALYLGPMRQLDPEPNCVAFQKSLSIEMTTVDGLAHAFPSLHKSYINAACVQGCVAARDNALRALRAHGGDERDYLAAKYLVTWQSLVMFGLNTGLNRSVIASLAPEIARW